MRLNLVGAAALALTMTACGYTREDRVTGGAATGAATGAAVGALAGPPGMLAGAAIGGVAGSVTGAATTPSEVNLGRPVWSNPEVRVGGRSGSTTRRSSVASAEVRRTQEDLAARGLYSGPIDGIMGPQTRAAMSSRDRGVPGGGAVTGSGGGATGMQGGSSTSPGMTGGGTANPGMAPAPYTPPPSGTTTMPAR